MDLDETDPFCLNCVKRPFPSNLKHFPVCLWVAGAVNDRRKRGTTMSLSERKGRRGEVPSYRHSICFQSQTSPQEKLLQHLSELNPK